MTAQRAGGTHSIFATTAFPRAREEPGEHQPGPTSFVHAKTMGTTTTLCGLSALSWFKFWDVAFADVRRDRCSMCCEALVQRRDAGERTR